jgi:radical SAM protein with 4Fe4S-binding SPASM domain
LIQDPPFAIQVEPTESCNLACAFCALQVIRDNGADWRTGTHGKSSGSYKFMSLKTAFRIADEVSRLGWNARVEFAMHGEPSLNPKFVDIIGVFRECLPKAHLMMTSNGAAFVKPKNIVHAFRAGLNTLALDDYRHANLVERCIDALEDSEEWDELVEIGVAFYSYPKEPEGNPHRRLRPNERMLTVVQDISDATSGTHANITNQGGDAGPLDRSMMGKRCAKPFRELSVRWDGNVAICCDSWTGQYKIGNVHDLPLDEIWNHPRFYAARQKLILGERDFGDCNGCNVRSYRPGLLPDKFGKVELPRPDTTTKRLISEALAGPPYTERVKPRGK